MGAPRKRKISSYFIIIKPLWENQRSIPLFRCSRVSKFAEMDLACNRRKLKHRRPRFVYPRENSIRQGKDQKPSLCRTASRLRGCGEYEFPPQFPRQRASFDSLRESSRFNANEHLFAQPRNHRSRNNAIEGGVFLKI